jgi:hypothetical protein
MQKLCWKQTMRYNLRHFPKDLWDEVFWEGR